MMIACISSGQYAPYITRQAAMLRGFLRDENLRLPPNIDYKQIVGLSSEERTLLQVTQPESIGQARRIEGMTPNGCIRLLEYVTKQKRLAAASSGSYKQRSVEEVVW